MPEIPLEQTPLTQVAKLFLYDPGHHMREAVREIPRRFGLQFSLTHGGQSKLEAMAAGVNKGQALLRLLRAEIL